MAVSTPKTLDSPVPITGFGMPSLRAFLSLFVRWSLAGIGWSLCLGCLAAVVLRLTYRDSIPGLAAFFYATPLALIWGGLATASGLFFALRKSTSALVAGLSAVVCWGGWQLTHGAPAQKPATSSGLRVVFWNTARLQAGWPPLAERIAQFSSPIMGFVEAGSDDPEDRERWRKEFPHHRAHFFGNGMVLLTQGKLLSATQGQLARGCYYGRATLQCAGQRLTVFLVDIHSNPFFCREQALRTLTALANEGGPEPVLIMGDFNTPSDSVHFRNLRQSFRNAFEVGGRGVFATWPVPCPVLAIDHVWTSRRIAVARAWHEGSLQSDHAAVIAELSFSE